MALGSASTLHNFVVYGGSIGCVMSSLPINRDPYASYLTSCSMLIILIAEFKQEGSAGSSRGHIILGELKSRNENCSQESISPVHIPPLFCQEFYYATLCLEIPKITKRFSEIGRRKKTAPSPEIMNEIYLVEEGGQ